jgi:poly(glycerol-phosphate) alpha-glucosyltransferase
MKISVLTTSVSRNAGGLFTSVKKLTQFIHKDGVACQVHAFKDEHTNVDVDTWAPLDVVTYNRSGLSYFPISLPMQNAVIDSHPDILHCHGIWLYPSVVDLVVKRNLGIPYVISPRGMLDPWAVRNSSWKKKVAGWAFENRHLKGASCIHALCQSEADSIRAYGLKNPIAVIPNGVDLPDFDFPTFYAQRSTTKRKLLFLGRIHPKKGLKELIAAWEKVQGAFEEEWELVIAGWDDGGHLEALKQQAVRLGLTLSAQKPASDSLFVSNRLSKNEPESSIHLVGPKFGEEKEALLRSVDAFILPSFSEGLPMSVLEAWSYGLPVIMTPQCNIPVGFDLAAAIQIDPEVDSIAEGLLRFFAMSEGEQKAMGLRGRRLVEERFTWKKIAEDMCNVYRWVRDGDTPPDCVRLN